MIIPLCDILKLQFSSLFFYPSLLFIFFEAATSHEQMSEWTPQSTLNKYKTLLLVCLDTEAQLWNQAGAGGAGAIGAAAPIRRAPAPFALDAEGRSRVRDAAAEGFLVSTELCCHVHVKDKKKKSGFGQGHVVDVRLDSCWCNCRY